MKILKHIISILFVGVLISCGEKKESAEKKPKEPAKTVKKTTKKSDKKEAFKKLLADLKTKTPVTKEQFESWLPKTILGLPQTSSAINFLKEKSTCTAIYKSDNKKITVNVLDAASNFDAGYLESITTINIEDFNSEYSYGYDKATTINDIKLREAYHYKEEKYTISTFYNQRFYITITTEKISHQELEQAIKELNLEHLKTL